MTEQPPVRYGEYHIAPPIEIPDYAYADGVWYSPDGAWLGAVMPDAIGGDPGEDRRVDPYSDDEGQYIPAPADWPNRIVEHIR